MSNGRILIADDNPLSLRFLADALESLGLACTLAPDGTQALARAQAQAFDILLLDARMPGLGGIDVLKAIRSTPGPSRHALALASTASTDAAQATTLTAAGFTEVIVKPVTVATLRAQLARHLPLPETSLVLDDAQALRAAGGSDAVVSSLRHLFADELDALPAEFETLAANQNPAALRERLHRLDASAGFCGAPLLLDATARLRAALDGVAWPQAALDDFLAVCRRTRQALDIQSRP